MVVFQPGPWCKKTDKHLNRRGRKRKQEKAVEALNRKARFFPKHKGKLRRGGGAWSVFRRERHAPPPTTAAGVEAQIKLRDEYRQLNQEERDRLNSLAEFRRQAARCGDSKITRRLSNTVKKVTWHAVTHQI